VWPVTRRQAGIYIRTATGGSNRDSDYTYAGTMPDVFSDSQFLLYDNTDTSKNLAFDLGSISTGTTRTLTAPDTSGTMAMEHLIQEFAPDEGGYLPLVSAFLWDSAAQKQSLYVDNGVIKYVGNTNLLVTLSDANLSANRSYSFPNASGTLALQGAITSSGLTQATSRLLGRTTASTGAVEELTVGNGLTLSSGTLAANFSAPPAIGSTTPAAGTFTTLAANNGTLTASAPVLDLSQTWNGTGVTFSGLKLNVTNTASATASALVEFQVGGTSYFKVTRGGNTGLATEWICSAADMDFSVAGHRIFRAYSSTAQPLYIEANGGLQFTPTNNGSASTNIQAESAATLAQRQGTTAQTYNIYNTYTSSTNYERGFLKWNTNVLQIGTEKGSVGGTARTLELQTDGSTRLQITAGGSILHGIGTGVLGWSASTLLRPLSGDGTLALYNNAQSDFGRLQFGGTTSSFPALKRSSTALQVRLADDSAYSVLDALHRLQGTAPATAGATGTAGDTRYDADYIYVCTATNTWKRAAIATW
jgi:hypothetical protein